MYFHNTLEKYFVTVGPIFEIVLKSILDSFKIFFQILFKIATCLYSYSTCHLAYIPSQGLKYMDKKSSTL